MARNVKHFAQASIGLRDNAKQNYAIEHNLKPRLPIVGVLGWELPELQCCFA